MTRAPASARARTLGGALALGVVYYLLALPVAKLQGPGTIAAIAWPAPAVAIAFLWPLPPRRWAIHLLAIFAAIVAVGIFDSQPWRTDVGFGALNVFEVVLCAWLGHHYVDRTGRLASTASLVRFLALLPLAGIGLTSVLGATLAGYLTHTDWWREWRTLMVGNGVAVLVLVPALLAWRPTPPGTAATPGTGPRHANLSAPIGSVAVVLILAAVAGLHLSEEVQRSALSLVLAATAIYGGLTGAAATVGTAAVLGVLLTLMHLGPYQYDGADSTWRLQVDMAGLAMLSFFVAVATRERRQLALRLEQARRMESLGLLAGGVAHDFKNILCAVDGFAEIAEGRLDGASPALGPLRELQTASARGRDLTEQILLAARRGDRVRETLALAPLVHEAVSLARPLARGGVAIALEPPDARILVDAHQGQLVRAVLNLVRNACQAAHAQVTVRVGSGDASAEPIAVGDIPPESAAWIEVADDGDGIPADHLPHLFEPFYSTRAKGAGTGLGLAIVAGVACEHQGGVSLATSASGTRFRLLLPSVQARAGAHAQVEPDTFDDASRRAPAGSTAAESYSGAPPGSPLVESYSGAPPASPLADSHSGAPPRSPLADSHSGAPAGSPFADSHSGAPPGSPLVESYSGAPAVSPTVASHSGVPASSTLATAALPADAPQAPPGNGETVILIDDDSASRERTEDWLAELGFEPLGYADAELALARAAQFDGAISLLLADVDRAPADAAAFAAGLRARAPALPVILCSAQPGLAGIAHAARAFALAKPFDREALGRAAALALKDL